jgi:hypothetical protein
LTDFQLPAHLADVDWDEVVQWGDYGAIARVQGHDEIYYVNFGSYQGEWLMVSKGMAYVRKDRPPYVSADGSEYYIWKGWYGSCSGCDSLQAEMGWDGNSRLKWLAFAVDYEPFVIVPVETMKNIVLADKLMEIFPANVRDESGDINYDEAMKDIMVAIKVEESLELTAQNILAVRNAELQQRGLKMLGYEKLLEQTQAKIIDTRGDDELLRIDDIALVHVKDSSTERRYLLRVPPGLRTVQAAVAWTFGLDADEYKPEAET